MPRHRHGLALAFAAIAAATAPAGTRADPPPPLPQLRVQSSDLLNPAQIGVVAGDGPVAKVTVRVPRGYALAGRLPVGAEVGFAIGIGSGGPDTAAFAGGDLAVADPDAAAADPAAQACDPSPHLAVLTATLADDTLGATADLTIFVDGPGADAAAAYILEYCPPMLAGQQLASVELIVADGVLLAPKAAAVYTWSAFVTPPVAGGSTPDTARTVELRAEVPIPDVLTLDATYDVKTHSAVLHGRYTKLGRPERAAAVSFHAVGPRTSADFGPIRTDANGRFAYRWAINERTEFTAHVASPPPGPCIAASEAPGGCRSITTAGPLDARVQVIPRSPREPRLAVRPADERLAAAIGLRRGDLPAGWQPVPASLGPPTGCEGFHPKETDLTETGSSATAFLTRESFDAGAVAVSSTTVLATRRQAAAYFAREAKLARIRCYVDTARSQGGRVRVERLPIAGLGRSAVRFRVTARQDDETDYFDEIGVLGARSVTFLLFTSAGGPSSLEGPVAARIAARAAGG